MGRQESVCLLFSMFVLQGITITIYYEMADLTASGLHIANFLVVALMQLLLIGLLVSTLLRFQFDNHQASMLWLEGKLNIWLVVALTLSCLFGFFLGCASSFISYFDTKSLKHEQWLYSTTTLLSFSSLIYVIELVKVHKRQTSCVRYLSYLVFIVLSITYLSQLGPYTKEAQFSAEIYFMAVLILLSLKIWWQETPLLLKMVLLAAEVIDIQSSVKLTLKINLSVALLVLEYVKSLVLAAHAIYTIVRLGQWIYNCIREHTDVKEDIPMTLTAINSLEKIKLVEDVNMSSHQLNEQEQVARQERECSICTMELPLGSEIFIIPCGHQYHCQCIKQWLLLRNSCPTCRTRVG